MSTKSSIPPAGPKSFAGILVITISALIMLVWSWNNWTDPLVDFGTQLYIPWQLVHGKVLYRDIAYYNGPLSQYLNAGAFAVVGVGLRTLVWLNLAFLAAVIVLIYQLAWRAVGTVAAVVCSVTFIILFAFNQSVGVGNFNWVTPYTCEMTQGMVLGLLTMMLVNRFQKSRRTRWLLAAGGALGLTFLTKAEPFAATIAATTAQLAADLWLERAGLRKVARLFAIFYGVALLLPLCAILFLAFAMTLHAAALAVAGSWRWVLDSRITSLPFYRHVLGTDDIPASLARICGWLLAYVSLLLPAAFLATRTPQRLALPGAIGLFLPITVLLTWQTAQVDWSAATSPFPLFLLIILIAIIRRIFRRLDIDSRRASLRLALVIFAAIPLMKVALNARIGHYGFALTAGATLVVTALLAEEIPTWINRCGGSGVVFQAAALSLGLVTAISTLRADNHFFTAKQWAIGSSPDRFRGDTIALEVQEIADLIQQSTSPESTLAVFPQGLMLNYLTRRSNPIPHINFMPPEVLAAGEENILAALAKNPPDMIVINGSSVRRDHFTLDDEYDYGKQTFSWITHNYEPVAIIELSPPYPTVLHLVLMRPKSNQPVLRVR